MPVSQLVDDNAARFPLAGDLISPVNTETVGFYGGPS